jgi:cyclic pyranopterin phosphate synthase
MLFDSWGRPTLNLRISLTQKCNLGCVYCHREGQTLNSASTEMTTQEVVRIAKIAVSLGISHIKLTGGEPLLRHDIIDIVKGIAKLRGLRDLSMTTNGIHLASLAKQLRKAGLMRVNVNLPTLDEKTYKTLNDGSLHDVLDGIKEAVRAGLYPVKLNMLVLRGVNEKEIPRMVAFARHTKTILQLLELEPINVDELFYSRYFYSLRGLEAELKQQAREVKTRAYMQNRHIYYLPKVKVEVVHPIENTEFCAHCTRLRVTSDGKLKPCLMHNDNLVDILTPMRKGAPDTKLKQLFVTAVNRREPYYKCNVKAKNA